MLGAQLGERSAAALDKLKARDPVAYAAIAIGWEVSRAFVPSLRSLSEIEPASPAVVAKASIARQAPARYGLCAAVALLAVVLLAATAFCVSLLR